MVSFEKPKFSFNFNLQDEIQNLLDHKTARRIPAKSNQRLLLCTWNVANLGLHQRTEDHYQLIAEIMSWFDIIAVQEVHDNLEGLFRIESFIGSEYNLDFSDKGGNDERAAYFYDSSKVESLAMTAELAIPPAEQRWIKLPGIDQSFRGFDRNPYIATFNFRNTGMTILNCHLYFGSDSSSDMNRRALEAYAVGRYCDLRRDDKHVYQRNMMAVGDFNIPMAEKGDPIFDALSKRGLRVPEHSTRMGSSIHTDAQYDQVAFFPNIKRKVKDSGVFDYDDKIFPNLWLEQPRDFKNYCRYYISDHRPMWAQLEF